MDSFEVNKLIGGLLGTVFVVFSIGLISDGLFASPNPEKPGYAIEATEPEEGGAAGAPAAEAKPIAELLAHADPKAGEAIFKKCQACHSGEKGGPNKVGPDLWDIVDRPVAEHEGFSYSAGMKEFSKGGTEHWTYDNLNHFLTSPKNFVKGTAMGFAGLKKDEDRANVIAYLRTLSDNPKPLPEPGAAAAADNSAKPAEGAAPAEGAKPAEGAAPAGGAKPAEGAAPAEGGAAKPAEGAAPAQGSAPAEGSAPAPAQ
jgi:cytochrome c